MGLARRPHREKLHWVEVKVNDGALPQSRVELKSPRGFPSSPYSSTSIEDIGDQGHTRPWASSVPIGTQSPCEVLRLKAETAEVLARELQQMMYEEQKRGDALRATVEQGHLSLRELELLAQEQESTTRRRLENKKRETEELRATLELSSRELMEKQAAHEGLPLSKENLSLVTKHKRKIQSLEVDLKEAKTVIEVLKVQAEANKTMKAFDTPVDTGLGALPVGSTSSTLTVKTPS
ncbi:hypothetical protein Esti_005234 [Eimeria stiedai]